MPICCGRVRAATVKYDLRHRCYALYGPTRGNPWPHSLLALPAGVDAHGREVLSPAYWSCLKPYTGRFRAALLRRSACGDRAARSPTSVLYPHTGRAAAAAVGLGGPYSGCCEGPGRLPHGKPGLGASQPGPAGRPWAAGHVFTELIGLIECHGAKRAKSEALQSKRTCNKPKHLRYVRKL